MSTSESLEVHSSSRSHKIAMNHERNNSLNYSLQLNTERFKSLLLLITSIGMLFRICIAMYQPHSGKSNPPMYGDFEAQRHWIEITKHLPISEWYFYDLEYWGLDYPPLTAFHHYLMGKFSDLFGLCEGCFDFLSSRGNQSHQTVMFMRVSVIVSDLVLYIPACFLLLMEFRERYKNSMWECIWLICFPSLILIDHGHFQFNNIFLGLTLLSIYFLIQFQKNDSNLLSLSLACLLFVCSVCYKQMALYYSLSFFFYILAQSLSRPKAFMVVALSVITSFGIIFAPFLMQSNGLNVFLQVIHRMFPFKRGLFEDKVASFWCSTSIFIKWNQLFNEKALVRLSTISTLVVALPSCLHLFYKVWSLRNSVSSRYLQNLFFINLAIVSFAFYLFSFQVHEKTILLPLLPCLLIYIQNIQKASLSQLIPFLNIVACFSMYPLFIKDNLKLVYVLVQILSIMISCVNFEKLGKLLKMVVVLSLIGMVAIHLTMHFVQPPQRYPDLFTLMCTTFSFAHFIMFTLLLYVVQFYTLDTKME
ncbi:hypothetical protein C9374_009704 [Naegleria lovaniensis]|uniref:Alpha-1,3-glucosyltransferase n=1 Tax=Naegleria lovaniensis TaxID=51637 RepID=A0AA88KRC6_NAELO|nr:uncharacterized protein C9374_009704 [Naegleria lovaniensis]KAG2393127.1 hypothetical protein C9374_009704 [Naegleria lovaniensis]